MRISFNNLGSLGIVKDRAPTELPPEAWTDGKNVRFDDDRVQQFPGDSVFATHSHSLVFCLAVPQPTDDADFIIANTLTGAWAWDGSSYTDIAATGSYSCSVVNQWNGCLLGGIAVVNNGKQLPQQWVYPPNASTALVALENWSTSWTCKVMRSFKNYLVALNVTKSGTDYPFMVKWSDAADPGSVPGSWDIADTTVDAGERNILKGGGVIIDGCDLDELFLIFRETQTWGMRFTGDNNIFEFQPLFQEYGIISANAWAVFDRKCFFVSHSEIIVTDGYSPQRILDSRDREEFYGELNNDFRNLVFVAPDYPNTEIRVCYPAADATRPNKALIWNYANNTVTFKDLQIVGAATVAGASTGGLNRTWDSITTTWNTESEKWLDGGRFEEQQVIFAAPNLKSLIQENSTYQMNGATYTSYVERIGVPFGQDRFQNPKVSNDDFKYVTAIYPSMDSANAGTIDIYVGGHNLPKESPTWFGPYAYDPSTDLKVDCRVTGRIISIRYEAQNNMGWALDHYEMEVQVMGQF